MTAPSSPTAPTCGGAPTPPWRGPATTAGYGSLSASTTGPQSRGPTSPRSGDRIAALQPVYDAVIHRFGQLAPDVARGIKLRHDWGPQYRSRHFLGSIAWLGMHDDAAFVGEPETNGCAERFIRTLKEQCLWAELHDTADDLRKAVADWTTTYNTEWLIQRHGHHTPAEAFASATTKVAA